MQRVARVPLRLVCNARAVCMQDVVRRLSAQLHQAGDVHDDSGLRVDEEGRRLVETTSVEGDRPRGLVATTDQRRRMS